jgi:glucose-1-phosphate adenylyltransferase
MYSLLNQLLQIDTSHKVKKSSTSLKQDMSSVGAIILGGGQGTRLFPLTHANCKPAILFGGRYRLIDIPISNALHSGITKIFVLTQFLARSLHSHIFHTYRHDSFSPGFIEILSAEQRPGNSEWYKGTADAVRQNIQYLKESSCEYFLILSGDQLYKMDYRQLIEWAEESDSDVVVATLPVGAKDAKRMGIMKVNEDQQIIDFLEKPSTEQDLSRMITSPTALNALGCNMKSERNYLGSMGIYLFKRDSLISLLESDLRDDFGKHLIPNQVNKGKVSAFIHDGYWEDIGTIDAFYHANMALNLDNPPFSIYDEGKPIFSTPCFLPGARVYQCQVNNSTLCEGSLIWAEEISNSLLGQNTIIRKGTIVQDSYIMGNDTPSYKNRQSHNNEIYSIGEDCFIKKAIFDKNVTIGNRVQLTNRQKLKTYDSMNVFIRDGIIVVPKGATIPNDFVL